MLHGLGELADSHTLARRIIIRMLGDKIDIAPATGNGVPQGVNSCVFDARGSVWLEDMRAHIATTTQRTPRLGLLLDSVTRANATQRGLRGLPTVVPKRTTE